MFTWYDETNNEDLLLPLSDSLIRCIAKQGWILGEKIGQGAEKAAFAATAISNSRQRAAILIGNTCDDDSETHALQRVRELQKTNKISVKDMIKVYPFIRCDTRITDDLRYCPHLTRQPKIIAVVELVGETLAERVYRMRKASFENKLRFAIEVYNRLREMYSRLAETGYIFSDALLDNFAYRENGDLIMIDLDGIDEAERDSGSPFRFDRARYTIDFLLFDVFNKEDFRRFAKDKSWKGVSGIALDEAESHELQQAFAQYVCSITPAEQKRLKTLTMDKGTKLYHPRGETLYWAYTKPQSSDDIILYVKRPLHLVEVFEEQEDYAEIIRALCIPRYAQETLVDMMDFMNSDRPDVDFDGFIVISPDTVSRVLLRKNQ